MSYLRRKHVMNELNNNKPTNLYYGIVMVGTLVGILAYYIALILMIDSYHASCIGWVSIVLLFIYYFSRLEKYNNTKENIKILMDQDIISIEKYKELLEKSNGFLRKELMFKFVMVNDPSVSFLIKEEGKELKILLDNITKGIYDKCTINDTTLIDYLKLNINNNNVGNMYWYSKQFNLMKLTWFCERYCIDNIDTLYFDMTKKSCV